MRDKFFSIITVSFNSGMELTKTLESVKNQSFADYEIIVKDGLSKDDCVSCAKENVDAWGIGEKVKFYETKDTGIYNAMNEAITYANGEYLIFLNCGDYFADNDVLEKLHSFITANDVASIYYGDRYNRLNEAVEYISPVITEAVCFRNIPCHQSIVYKWDCFEKEAYRDKYRVRADYEHFLRLVLGEKKKALYTGIAISSYQGGGYSESAANRKRSAEEHKEITGMYIPASHIFKYKMRLILTLAPLRNKIATNPKLSGAYQKLVKRFYK